MSVYQNSATPTRGCRARLLAGCALAAALTTPALGQQAFEATPSVVSGNATIFQGETITGGLRDRVFANTPQVVIDWTPNDGAVGGGPITILPAGNELHFQNNGDIGVGQYTVLNRIIPDDPSRAVQFDGHVISQLDTGYGAIQGGNIWFYSPGGIIAGATSRFDVGSLVLSANDIDISGGLFGDGSSSQAGTIRFRGDADSRSAVTIMPGAQINASGNYVALVAPRISQGGSMNVEGGAALVAAESADITIPISGGLFDIAVQTGSRADAGGETTLSHSGTTELRDAAQTGAARRVYLMAVPKNDAVTMLVSGSLGYAPAVQAQLAANGAIYLTTGDAVPNSPPGPPVGQSTIHITGGDFGGQTIASAQAIRIDTSTAALNFATGLQALAKRGPITLSADSGRNLVAGGDILLRQESPDLNGLSSISASASQGSTLQTQSLRIENDALGTPDSGYGAIGARSGTVSVSATSGGIITVADDISISSSGTGGQGAFSNGGAGFGGTVSVSAAGGQISAASLDISADGIGGDTGYGDLAGFGRGGTVEITAVDGGLDFGQVTVSANGIGGYSDFGRGGSGTGGTAKLLLTRGTLDAGSVSIGADGSGGDGNSGSGVGQGGTVSILNNTSSSLFAGSGIDLSATGRGGSAFGNSAALGDGTGGTITIATTASSFSTGEGWLETTADGIGGFSNVFNPTIGRGGSIAVTVNSLDPNNVESSFSAAGMDLSADGRINLPLALRGGVLHGNSGTGVGGNILLNLTGGPAFTGDITLSASGTGANGDYGVQAGAGFAGRAELAMNGGTLQAGSISILAEATGGGGAFAENGYGMSGAGGTAGVGANPFGTGSGAYLTGTGGSLSATSLLVSADATGGFGGDGQVYGSLPLDAASGGAALGGTAQVMTGNVDLAVGDLSITAQGTGGGGGTVDYSNWFGQTETANAGSGGTATGGSAAVAISGGTHSLGNVSADASGFGGLAGLVLAAGEGGFDPMASGRGGNGGEGSGGSASIIFTGATIADQPDLRVDANGVGSGGGSGARGGDGGAGAGGEALVRLSGGTADLYRIRAFGYAEGGSGGFGATLGGGNGGNAEGGTASFNALNGAVVNVADDEQFDPFDLDASAFAGSGGDGGSFAASGVGGDGGAGGSASGGSATALFQSGAQAAIPGVGGVESRPPTLIVSAEAGSGGNGGTGSAFGGIGGDGGIAVAGLATLDVQGASAAFGDVFTEATAQRGFGGAGGSGESGIAASGSDGQGFGGRLVLTVADAGGQAGAFKAGDFSADLGGSDVDGSLFIGDTGSNASGGIRFGSLYSVSFSNALNESETSSDYDIQSSARTIAVDGDVDLTANGDIRFAFQGAGGIASETSLDIRSRVGGISITNDSPAATLSASLGARDISLRTSNGDIVAGPGTLLASSGSIDIGAIAGNARLANARAGDRVSISAGISEGALPFDATVTGTVTSNGGITISAGRDTVIAPDAKVVADQYLTISSGDDIVIGSGALVRAANNPPPETGYGATDPLEQFSQLRLLAGGLDTGEEGNVASILIDGTLEAPDRTLFISAGAVRAGSTTQLTAGNLYVRLNDVPVGDQVPSDDGGQLTGACLQGSVCLGTANVDGIVRIGETGSEPINLRLNGGIDGTDVLLRGRSVELGQAGIANFIRASDILTIESLSEKLTLDGPLAVTGGGNVARIAAFRSIDGAAAQVNAPGTLDLFAGNDITLAGLSAGAIRTVDFDGNVVNGGGLTVPGTIAIGRITSGSALDLNAGKDIALDSFDVTGTATLTAASGTVDVATDASASQGTTATARAVMLSSLTGLNVTSASATAGDLMLAAKAGTLAAGNSSASGNVALTGGGPISFAMLSAGNALMIAGGGDLSGGTANAGVIAIDTSGTFKAATLTAGAGDLAVSADNGITLPVFDTTGAATLTAASGTIKVDTDAKAANGITAIGQSVSLQGQNGLNVTSATATAGDLSLLSGGNPLNFGIASATGEVTLLANGNVSGDTLSGGTITVSATGSFAASSLGAGSGGLDVSAWDGITISRFASNAGATLASELGSIVVSTDAQATDGIVAIAKATDQSISLTGAHGLKVTSATADRDVSLTTTAGNIDFGALYTLNANGIVSMSAAGDISGDTVEGGRIAIDAPGALTATSLMTIGCCSGAVDISATNGITASSIISASGPVRLTATNGSVTVSTDAQVGQGITATGRSILLVGQHGLNIVAANATSGDLSLTTAQGPLTIGMAEGGSILVSAAGTLKAGQVVSASDLSLAAQEGLTVDVLSAAGTATLKSANGPLVVTTDLITGAGLVAQAPTIGIMARNGLDVLRADATAGDLKLATVSGTLSAGQSSATGGIALTSVNGDVAVGDVSAMGAFAANAANGLIAVNGNVRGSTIALTSKDIAVGSSAQLGSKMQTMALTLTSTADRLFLGDAPQGSGYRLDAAEFARIASGGDITIASAPQGATGEAFTFVDPAAANVVLGTLAFDGGQFGANGTLLINSPSAIGLVGNLQFKAINAGQTVTLRSASDIALAAETGLVTLKESTGLSGTLRLEAQQVQALSTKARTEIAGLDLNAVRQRLGTNDQLENDGGYFQAGQIVVRIDRLAFIQNSGANGTDPDTRRGFTTNNFRVESSGTQPAQVVLNGRIGNVDGADLINAVAVSGSVDMGSSFNGCTAGAQCGIPPGPPPEVLAPVLSVARDQIVEEDKKKDEKEETTQASQSQRPTPLIQILNVPTSRFDPLIDQPVTGAGNEDLWMTPISPPQP